MKGFLAAAIITLESILCIFESVAKNREAKVNIEKLIFFVIALCGVFNLVLVKFNISGFKIQAGLLSFVLAACIYMLLIMHKKQYAKDNNAKFMLFFLTAINIYIFCQPLFIYMYSPEAYSKYLFTYFNIELMLILFLLLKSFEYDIKTITGTMTLFSLANDALALLQGITGKMLIDFKNPAQELTMLSTGHRVSGFVSGDNGGGNLGVILFPVLLYTYKKNKKPFTLILVLADAVFVIFTFTRTAYLALGVEIIIFIISFIKPNSIKDTFKKAFKLTAALGACIYLYANYFSQGINMFLLQRGDTQLDRFEQFPKAFKAFFSTPLIGTGHGQYNDYLMHKLGLMDELVIHSQLLNILVEEGVIIFTIFCALNIYIIYLLFKKYKKKKEILFIIMLFFGNLICINFNPNQTYEINIYIYYFILFGFFFAEEGEEIVKKNNEKHLLQFSGQYKARNQL